MNKRYEFDDLDDGDDELIAPRVVKMPKKFRGERDEGRRDPKRDKNRKRTQRPQFEDTL